MKFINVVAKWPGSIHDARILRESILFEKFESHPKPVTGWLLGDSGYMLRDWLLTPHRNPATHQERKYNICHSSTRSLIKRSIGVAKRRWHCLRRLRLQPSKACQVITVCLMLHNRARYLNLADPDSDSDCESDSDSEPDSCDEDPLPATERRRVAVGQAVRDRLINDFF